MPLMIFSFEVEEIAGGSMWMSFNIGVRSFRNIIA
jgi:hypothetical protein